MIKDFLAQVLVTSTSILILLSLAAYLFRAALVTRLKSAIETEYAKQLESHKSDLKKDADHAIENVKNRLSVMAFERQVVFQNLHEKRAEVVAETYSLLKTLMTAVEFYTVAFEPVGITPKDDRHKAVVDAHQALRAYYPKKAIFLPKNVAAALVNIDLEIVRITNQYLSRVHHSRGGDTFHEIIAVRDQLSTNITAAIESLENEFRILLGEKG